MPNASLPVLGISKEILLRYSDSLVVTGQVWYWTNDIVLQVSSSAGSSTMPRCTRLRTLRTRSIRWQTRRSRSTRAPCSASREVILHTRTRRARPCPRQRRDCHLAASCPCPRQLTRVETVSIIIKHYSLYLYWSIETNPNSYFGQISNSWLYIWSRGTCWLDQRQRIVNFSLYL